MCTASDDEIFVTNIGKVLVYGNTLDAFCCIQVLLSLGFASNRIIFVLPPNQSGVRVYKQEIVLMTPASSYQACNKFKKIAMKQI